MGASAEEIANLKAALGIETKIKETVREMQENIEKANAARAAGRAGAEALQEAANAALKAYKDQVKSTNKLIAQQQKIIENERERSHSLEAQRQLHDQHADNIQRQIKLLKDRHLAEETSVQTYLDELRILERQLALQQELADSQEKYTISVEQSVDAAKDMAGAFGGMMAAYQGNELFNYKNIMGFATALFSGEAGLLAFASKLGSVGLAAFVDSVIGLALELDQAESAFRRTTGASASMAREMTNSYEATRESTVSAGQNQEAWGALYTTYTDFTMISEEARAEIGQTTAVLTQLGIGAHESAAGMQVATKMMGQTGTQAASTLVELSSLAENLGVAPKELIAQYGQMGSSLAKLGSEGTKAFKDLARVSKITGLEMQKILTMTDKFDTFEGAATQAGKLNAALGGNFVNAMDLMMATDPVERFEMLRGSLDEAGLSFDDMSYYQRKFYADSLGLESVGDLALMMSGNMEALGAETQQTSADYADAAARAAEMASVQESLKAVLQSIIPVLVPLLDKLAAFGNWLVTHIDTIKFLVKWVGGAIVVWKGLLTTMMLYQKALLAVNAVKQAYLGLSVAGRAVNLQDIALKRIDIVLQKLGVSWGVRGNLWRKRSIALGLKAIGVALWQNTVTIAQNAIHAAAATGRGVLAAVTWVLAAAQGALTIATGAGVLKWVLLAAAIGLVAYALLASIHSPPLYIAIPLVAAGLWLMSFALAAITGPATAAAIPLILVGFGLVQIAGAVFIVAVGVGLMAAGFALMFAALEVDKIMAFTGMIATLALAAVFLPYAAIGMFALGIGLLSVAFALKFIATKDLEAIALFSESLASIQSGQLLETAKAIKQVAKAMDDIPTYKAMTFRTILERVEASANAINRAGGATAYGDATGGARGGGGGGAAAPAAAAPRTNQQVTVKLELDGKLLEEKVLNIVDGKFAEAS